MERENLSIITVPQEQYPEVEQNWNVVIQVSFAVEPRFGRNLIQEIIMRNSVIPSTKLAADVLANKLKAYVFDLLKVNHL